jgi:lipoprotein-anchoring transpeptidase ErfK/SrfK
MGPVPPPALLEFVVIDRSMRSGLRHAILPHISSGSSRRLVVNATAAVTVLALTAGCGSGKGHAPGAAASRVGTGKLPLSTTFTTLKGIPTDTGPASAGNGTVVHPLTAINVSAVQGGPPVAILPSTEVGSPTWVPVIDTKPGWDRVLLPSRPNHAAGWIPTGDRKVQTAHSSFVIKVDTTGRKLTLMRSGRTTGTWTVAVGAPKTPTPTGRTFLMASLVPSKKTYSPLILPVGAHSETLDSFGGGPGTVAFHGWPQQSVFGKAVTNGCVRVPADALTQLSKVPLGTPVLITS